MSHKESRTKPVRIFAGDLSDRLVAAILSAIDDDPAATVAYDWPEGERLPDDFPNQSITNDALRHIVIHRRSLGQAELSVLAQLRRAIDRSDTKPRLELVAGDLVRYADLQIAAPLVDRIVPEAVSPEVYAAKSLQSEPGTSGCVPVGILTTNRPLAETLREACESFGYRAAILSGWSDPAVPRRALLVWDVPLLSDRWEVRLRDQSRLRPILTLLGLADRGIVDRARGAGAVACLDLPFEFEDLRDTLARHAVMTATQAPAIVPPQHVRPASEDRQPRDFARNLRTDEAHRNRHDTGSHLGKFETPAARVNSERTNQDFRSGGR